MSSAAGHVNVAATPTVIRRRRHTTSGLLGAAVLLLITLPCLLSLPWSVTHYDRQNLGAAGQDPRRSPSLAEPFGADNLGRSVMWRCLLGGAISLGIGLSAAFISVVIGVTWGATAGFAGGRVDALLMRVVDLLWGLPYILLVVLLDLAIQPAVERAASKLFSSQVASNAADVVTLLMAIGAVSWLTLARVIRGQVLSLRSQPFVEAARACGASPARVFVHHLLPNLVGPIVVYSTLTVPTAILQESFLSFLGIGVQDPLPSWGNLAAGGLDELHALASPTGAAAIRWWMLLWPCLLLALTLMALNFLGDDLRQRLDPRGRRR